MAESSEFVRPSEDEYFMNLVHDIASRGECRRRKVGAIITDRRGRILSTGMNGVAPGQRTCLEAPCPGASAPSGSDLDLCQASHAEISALVTLDKPFEAHTIYCTTEPCVSCTKALLLTSIQRILYRDPYPTSGRDLWVATGRISQEFKCEDTV